METKIGAALVAFSCFYMFLGFLSTKGITFNEGAYFVWCAMFSIGVFLIV